MLGDPAALVGEVNSSFLLLSIFPYVPLGGRHRDAGGPRRQIGPDDGVGRDPPPRSGHDAAPPAGHTGNQPGLPPETSECVTLPLTLTFGLESRGGSSNVPPAVCS